MQVLKVEEEKDAGGTVYGTNLQLMAVGDKAFDADGNSEDNMFARWTPSASLTMSISNPNLFGKFKTGQKFYVDFTEASS